MEDKTEGSVWGIDFRGNHVYYNHHPNVAVLDTTTMMVIDTIEIGMGIYNLAVSEDGRHRLLACRDNTARVVDVMTKKSVTLTGHAGPVWCIIECDDRYVLTGSFDNTIKQWDRLTGEVIRTYAGHNGIIFSIVYEKRTKRIFSGLGDTTIMVWNAETGVLIGGDERAQWCGILPCVCQSNDHRVRVR